MTSRGGGVPMSTGVREDEIERLLADARAASEANSAPPRERPRARPAMPGAGPWWHDVVRHVTFALALLLVLLLGRATGFL